MPLPPAALAAFLLPTLLLPASGPDPSTASEPTLHVGPVEDPLPPGTERETPVSVSVPCSALPARVRLSLADERPRWLDARLAPAEADLSAEGCEGAARFESILLLAVGDDAPAFHRHVVEARALVESDDLTRELSSHLPVEAAYFAKVSVVPEATRRKAGEDGLVRFPLRVENLGNHHTRVAFEVVDNPRQVNVLVPPPVTLESRATGGDHTTATVDVAMQAARVPDGSVTLRIVPAYALDPKLRGEAQTVTLHVEGPANAVPPAAAPLVAALVAASALALRAARRP